MLIVLDVDSTLCDSSAAAELLPADATAPKEAFEPWRQKIYNTNFPPVEGAQSYLNILIGRWDQDEPLEFALLTGRGQDMKERTLNWVKEHFPNVYKKLVWPSFRDADNGDLNKGHISKGMRLKQKRLHDQSVWVFDDDSEMMNQLQAGDLFSHVIDSWPPASTVEVVVNNKGIV